MPHSTTLSDEVLSFLCDRRFHRQFTYTSNGMRRRVSYSDYGSLSSKAVVLFFGGLMGGRLSYSTLDALAKKHNIRIINPDRPGMGGSSSVALDDRIRTYVDMIPHLLRHLGIAHVSLACHSFGTIYALNTLLLYPHLLHPSRPYVAFFAPWVHPSHTGVRHLQAAEMLPAGMIGKFSSLARFVNGSVAPVIGMSSGLSSTVAKSLRGPSPRPFAAEGPNSLDSHDKGQRQNEGDVCALDLDDADVVKELRSLIPTFLFAENVDGAGQDAQLCLRKPRSIPWSTPSRPWDDVDDAVRQLRCFIAEGEHTTEVGRRWNVDAFHAETDAMVGEKGRMSFDECWLGDRTVASGQGGIAYQSQIVEGSDHDFILDPVFGASEKWLERVAEAFGRCAGEIAEVGQGT